MNDMNHSKPWIATTQVTELLDELYADAQRNDPLARRSAMDTESDDDSVLGFYRSMRMAYMAIGWEFGRLLYGLARFYPGRNDRGVRHFVRHFKHFSCLRYPGRGGRAAYYHQI